MRRLTHGEQIKPTAEFLSDLNMFYAIIALCEDSMFSTASYRGEECIVKFCKAETARCLAAYDKALAAAQLLAGDQ